jgi:hypothetical protein
MTRSLFQVVAVVLLSATVAVGAGAMHVLSATAAPAPWAGCHHSRVAPNPPAPDYRCCMNGHRTALLNRIFSPRPTVQVAKLPDAVLTLADAGHSNAVPEASVRSSGLPPILILRI